ncbi:hypothetical protein AVEN_43406-1 [Araneus ventricosus]|uniref:Uncharacterized protein n=1 Tax=Araneus ventricosus TaxID=182803 RepID=A0A4Y2JIN9_ARAVE|nr:hypothetical protein AVEN_43406-1 [Araneus ventricosus]
MCFYSLHWRIINTTWPGFEPLGVPGFTPSAEVIKNERERGNYWIKSLFCVIFLSQHGPFPAYLKRFHLSDSDYCSCGVIGTAPHYATECLYTVSWHMRKPAPNFEQA